MTNKNTGSADAERQLIYLLNLHDVARLLGVRIHEARLLAGNVRPYGLLMSTGDFLYTYDDVKEFKRAKRRIDMLYYHKRLVSITSLTNWLEMDAPAVRQLLADYDIPTVKTYRGTAVAIRSLLPLLDIIPSDAITGSKKAAVRFIALPLDVTSP